jgi:hypothetical protein
MSARFDAHVIQSYKALLNERSVKYQATSEGFTLNTESDVLTTPQRDYLEGLSELVAILGITPSEFDREFRYQLSEQVMGVYAQTKFALAKGPVYGSQTSLDIKNVPLRTY